MTQNTRPTLLLVDGSGYLFRAFHALPDLRNRQGEPTGAIYGVVGMLRKLREDPKLNYGANFGAVVFDAPGKTFRDDLYPQYKATRSAMPDDLRAQIEPIHQATRALGWPLIMIDGVEADDVIGTLAVHARRHGIRTVISTGDKDLAQLVNDDVILFNTMTRDGSPPKPLDAAGVEEKFGVRPERIVDWLTLVGDSVDNVPGVDKIGPKTAVKLLTEYGSLDALRANAEAVKGVVGQNLRGALDWLPTARTLVTIKTDCELPAELTRIEPALAFQPEDAAGLAQFFERYGMRTLLRNALDKVAEQAGEPAASAPNAVAPVPDGAPATLDYDCVLTEAQLDAWLARIEQAELTAVDTETTSLDPMNAQIVGVSLSVAVGQGCYVPLAHRYPGAPEQLSREFVLGKLKPWLENPRALKVGQNLKYDQHVLENHGVKLAGIAHDTLLQSYVLEPHRTHDMDSLAARHLNRTTITYDQVAGKGAAQIGFDEVALEQATRYAAEDAEVTLHLHRTLWPQVQKDSALTYIYRDLELPIAQVLQKIERNGVRIDPELLAVQSNELSQRMHALEQQAYEVAGGNFNLNSPKQIGEIFFQKLKLPVHKKTASGVPSTDEDVLEKLAADYPLPKILLDFRSLAKLKGTYVDKLPRMINPRTGRVHTNYGQAIAVTGRLASTDPNLQNIPIRTPEGRRIREAFVAAPGCSIVSADYSQIELRIMAHISQDPGLLHAFEHQLDVHRATASEVFGIDAQAVSAEQRRYAKVINFGLIYGMSAFGLAANLGIERGAARSYIERYFARYPGVAQYMEQTRVLAKQQGYVETVFGRKLWLAEINSPNGPRRQAAERSAINAPMQGTAADLIKMAMIAVQAWLEQLKLGTRLIMQVHDELVLEVPDPELELVREHVPAMMAAVAKLRVPLVAEIGVGPNWDQAH